MTAQYSLKKDYLICRISSS